MNEAFLGLKAGSAGPGRCGGSMREMDSSLMRA